MRLRGKKSGVEVETLPFPEVLPVLKLLAAEGVIEEVAQPTFAPSKPTATAWELKCKDSEKPGGARVYWVCAACPACGGTFAYSGLRARSQVFHHCGRTEVPPAELAHRLTRITEELEAVSRQGLETIPEDAAERIRRIFAGELNIRVT